MTNVPLIVVVVVLFACCCCSFLLGCFSVPHESSKPIRIQRSQGRILLQYLCTFRQFVHALVSLSIAVSCCWNGGGLDDMTLLRSVCNPKAQQPCCLDMNKFDWLTRFLRQKFGQIHRDITVIETRLNNEIN